MIMNAFKKDTTFVKIQHLKGRCHQAKLRKLKNFAKLTKQKWIFLVTYYASTILGGVADAWGQKFYKYIYLKKCGSAILAVLILALWIFLKYTDMHAIFQLYEGAPKPCSIEPAALIYMSAAPYIWRATERRSYTSSIIVDYFSSLQNLDCRRRTYL